MLLSIERRPELLERMRKIDSSVGAAKVRSEAVSGYDRFCFKVALSLGHREPEEAMVRRGRAKVRESWLGEHDDVL